MRKLEKKIIQKQIKKQINIYDDLIKSYKVDLWDIEHDNLPEEGVFRDEWIRVKLIGTDCKNLEEYQIYALNQIKIYTEKLKQCYDQLARFSQWKPSE